MKAIRERLFGELSPEQEILRNRMVMGTVAGLGCYYFGFDSFIFSAFFAYLSLNATLCGMRGFEVWKPEERWLAAIILDVMMAFAVMMREPEHLSVFYPIILWMILGNGFRYGIKWLYVATFLSAATFAIVVISTSYWQENFRLGIALTIALVAIPAYCSTLIRKISYAKEQAELASKAKSYFLASVSHELRTPLNAIIGYGNHLRQSDMPRVQKEMVEASVLAGEHLLHQIEQLIDVAKAGASPTQVKRTTFRPTDLLTEIRDIMTVRVEEKGLALHLQAEPLSDQIVEGPVSVIRNILLNLVGNASKFTQAGSISISSGITARDDQHFMWFVVSDTGIGICPSATDRIFQPFQQADDTVMTRFGGTGLGLSICKQLIEQVNGRISVESRIGQGSKFRVEIPVQQSALAQPEPTDKIKILSFGTMKPELLANAQSHENFYVRHLACANRNELQAALGGIQLDEYRVALISADVAAQINADDCLWTIFADAEVAPVLVSQHEVVEVEELTLRAAFASVIPATPNFAELRSAIRIGCSFARQMRMTPADDAKQAELYTPRRVLVADDNPTNRNVLAAILQSAGHDIHMVTDGDEALEALERGGTDILLLDVNMPRLNGIEACSMWRQIEGARHHLPIIGVTADATTETEQKCLSAGMDLRLTKPVDAKLLLSTIEKYCGTTSVNDCSSLVSGSDPLKVVVPITGNHAPVDEAIDDRQIAYLRSIGGQPFIESMIEGFLEDVNQMLEALHQSIDANDVRQFRFCAHALKSSGNNMGATSLAQLCGRLEFTSEADFLENKLRYRQEIEHKVAAAVAALTPYAPASASGAKAQAR